MKIILDEIEFILPEPTFQMIKDAYNHGRVQKASELSKNYWSYQIKHEDKLLECELKYGKNQVSKILCACGRTNIKQPCLHAWIAAYWHYKKVVCEKNQNKPVKEKVRLEHLDFSKTELSELTRFIQLTIKLNKNLETWVQLIIPSIENGVSVFHQFTTFLNNFNPHKSTVNKNNKLKLYKEQLLAIDFIYEQALHDFIQGSLEKAFYKMLACFIKLSEWLPEYKLHNHAKMMKLNNNLYHATDQALKSIKSAELSESLFKSSMDILTSNINSPVHYKENIYQLLLNNTKTKNQKKIIEDHIKHLCCNRIWLLNNEVETIFFLINNLDFTEFKKTFTSEPFEQISNQSWLILIQKIKEADLLLHYIEHLKLIFEKSLSTEVKRRIAQSIIESYIYNNNLHSAKEDAKHFSIVLKDINMAKIYFSDNESSNIEHYIDEYYKLYPKSDDVFLLQLLHILEEKDLLLNYFIKTENIDDIFAYDSILYKTHWEQIKNIYLNYSENYLDNFVGLQANQFLEKVKSNIKLKTNKIQFENFNSEFQKRFPERLKITSIK